MAHRVHTSKDGDHTILHGDTLKILPTLRDRSIDLIFADPPYNIGKKFANFIDKWPSEEDYVAWCIKWLELCIKKLTTRGSLYVMTSTQCMPHLDLFLRTKLTVLSRIVWYYDSSGVQAKNYFGSLYEPIIHCVVNPKDYTFNGQDILIEARTGSERKLIDYRKTPPAVYNSHKIPGNVWNIPRVRYRMSEYEHHPSQKPEALLERIIMASSNPEETVMDPFAGTFTTGAVAQKLNRQSVSMEQEEDYIKIGLRRLKLQSTYKGATLHPPKKNFKRKN